MRTGTIFWPSGCRLNPPEPESLQKIGAADSVGNVIRVLIVLKGKVRRMRALPTAGVLSAPSDRIA